MIADLEDKFELNKTNLDAEGKYKAIVLMFGEAVAENLKYDIDYYSTGPSASMLMDGLQVCDFHFLIGARQK